MPSQPPRKNVPDLDLFPNVQSGASTPLSTETRVLFGIKELIQLVSAVALACGIYYGLQGSIAVADTKATDAAAAVVVAQKQAEQVAAQVREHETVLRITEATKQAEVKDLDRRFGEVKKAQEDSEKRVIQAISDLKNEVRKGR